MCIRDRINTSSNGDVYELEIIVNAKNINSTVDDKFTLVVDAKLKAMKESANIIANFANNLNNGVLLGVDPETQ